MFEPTQQNMVPPDYHEGPYQDEFNAVVNAIHALDIDSLDAVSVAVAIVDGFIPWVEYQGSAPW